MQRVISYTGGRRFIRRKTDLVGDSVADVEIDAEEDPPGAFGPALRRARLARGVSLRALGLRVHYSKGHLSKIENGVVQAHLDLAEACDAVLGANGRLTALFLAEAHSRPAANDLNAAAAPFDILPQPSYFTGRADEASLLFSALLSPVTLNRAPVALIHGMAGSGKTALALHVAHAVHARYPGGCLFIGFGAEPEPASAVLRRLLLRLGVSAEAIPVDPGEARARYLSILYRRPVLVVADNVTRSDQVEALVSASPDSAVIATSRRRLDALDDCLALRLGPLADNDAAALFRAIAARPEALPDDDLARIVTACGGLPLAIRVAAARFRASGRSAGELADLLERLPAGWAELDDGERSVKRSLQTELDALPDSGRQTLAMLTLCPAGAADSDAVAWLTDRESRAMATEFAELRRNDLITLDPHGRASTHALIRALAVSLADRIDERSRAQAVHRLIVGYAQSAAAADGLLTPMRFRPPDAPDADSVTAAPVRFDGATAAMTWCRRVADCIPDLCALAYDQGFDAECWRLAYAMRGYFFTVKALQPWEASHRTALLAAERGGDLWAQAVTRNNLGMALAEQRRISAADAQYDRALEILQTIGDRRGVAATLGHQAWSSHADGRYQTAIALAGQAIAMHRKQDDARSLAIMDRTAALANSKLGGHQVALAHLAECEEILSGLDLPLDRAMTFNCLGEVHYGMGRFDQADAFHARAADLSAACGGIGEEARAVRGMAVAARALGATARADDLHRRAATLRSRFEQTSVASISSMATVSP
jgi:tetratricopeptide (TPR) repeat protein/transcriptional regulator with XRE-family HTH domain